MNVDGVTEAVSAHEIKSIIQCWTPRPGYTSPSDHVGGLKSSPRHCRPDECAQRAAGPPRPPIRVAKRNVEIVSRLIICGGYGRLALRDCGNGARLRKAFDRRASALGVTRAQWKVLFRLTRMPGMRQVELADMLEVEPITLCRIVDRLEEAGLVKRQRDPAGSPRVAASGYRAGKAARREVEGCLEASSSEKRLSTSTERTGTNARRSLREYVKMLPRLPSSAAGKQPRHERNEAGKDQRRADRGG